MTYFNVKINQNPPVLPVPYIPCNHHSRSLRTYRLQDQS
nr:MAG TPA: hypothetical protein [Caudoviricetes sp.]